MLDPEMHHHGDTDTPEWQEAPAAPQPGRYELLFEATSNLREHVLVLTQRHVNDAWAVLLNGRKIAQLERKLELVDVCYRLPPGSLVPGQNVLLLVPSTTTDDITVGHVRLIEQPLREYLDLQSVEVQVVDADSGKPLPARVTVVDEQGQLATIYEAESERTAVRPGVLYVGEGSGHLELPKGRYQLWATRGTEWGLGSAMLELGDEPEGLTFSIRREVDTSGFVAADTHIHTLTFSGHGDANLEERMVTLAGEGVELAIATDHDHNTDYRPAQWATGTGEWFTPVTGNEVTTSVGHFNAFPLDPTEERPTEKGTDWKQLVAGMRSKGAQVVILNHPRWPSHEKGPFGVLDYVPATGRRAADTPFLFDAMELVNSQTHEPKPLSLFHDWFGLLNRGEPISAVGSSDSHTVAGVVGAGRTYVPSTTDDPAAIDVDAACQAMAAGQTTLGMGFFVDVRMSEAGAERPGATPSAGGPGTVVRAAGGTLSVSLRVAAPSWVLPREALVFSNGDLVATRLVPTTPGEPTDVTLDFALQLQAGSADAHEAFRGLGHDAWVVCVVLGDGIDGPWFPLVNDYTLAATNPVYLDVDGDGRYGSPRASAQAMLDLDLAAGREIDGPQGCDPGVALQYLDLLEDVLVQRLGGALRRAGRGAAAAHPTVEEYLRSRQPKRDG